MILNILSLASLAVGSLFVLIGLLPPSEWITLVAYVLGLHSVGSGVNHVAQPFGQYLLTTTIRNKSNDKE
jgi:hypothetical protein